MKLDALDSDSVVSTDDILKIIANDYIRILKEKQDLQNAISKLHAFFYQSTPEWIEEPVIDTNTGTVIKAGVPRVILYQYEPKYQHIFEENSLVISFAMSAIPDAIEYLEDRFWKLEHLQQQTSIMNIPQSAPPVVPPKESITQKIADKFSGIADRFSKTPHNRIQTIIDYYEEIPEVWGLILEYHHNSVARRGASWTSINTRMGMENILQILQSNFSYWVEPKLMEIVSLAQKARMRENKQFADKIVSAMAYQQKTHEQAEAFGKK